MSKVHKDLKDLGLGMLQYLMQHYYKRLWEILEENPNLKITFPTFILNPEKVLIYIGKTHIAIEYIGLESADLKVSKKVEAQIFDYTKADDFFSKIIGFEFDGTGVKMPLPDIVEDLFIPTSRAHDILIENKWNHAAESMVFGFNVGGFEFLKDEFSRLVNCFFYGTDSNGLVVRNVKWLDVFPLHITDIDDELEEFTVTFWPSIKQIAELDARYPWKKEYDFKSGKLAILNRFVELFSSSGVRETDITHFLTQPENQFILKMAFFAIDLFSEKECEWADGDRKPIRPDFFVSLPNGYTDIVEFKLPTLKSNAVVGNENRETFSAEMHSYVAQTRVYNEYFNDPRNRKIVKDKYKVDVYYPKRWLIVGRRWMFSSDEWKQIEHEYRDFAIRTYDDLIDGVSSQLYS